MPPKIERRIAKVARHVARLVGELRNEGQHEGAERLVQAGIEICDNMRAQARRSVQR